MSSGLGSSQANEHLNAERAKGELLSAFTNVENTAKLQEAKDMAGNDMLKMMQYVFPLAAEIQMDVIKNYGYSHDGKGATQFALAVKSLEKDDPEIASLNTRLRSYFIPPMIPTASLKPNDQ